MSEATLESPVEEPLRELVDDWSRSESGRAEELQRLLEPIEQALGQLGEWAERASAAEQSEAEARRDSAEKEQAAEQRRKKLEHDLKLARARVTELERSLQERTEELLRVQAANNELAAQLQEIGDDEPLAEASPDATAEGGGDPVDGDLMILPDGESLDDLGDQGDGVAERFARLRQN